MSTSERTIEYVLGQLSSLPGIRVRRMFGEYALYMDDVVIGLICDDQIFIKYTDTGKEFAQNRYEEGYAYPGAKPSMNITESIDDAVFFTSLVSMTATLLPKTNRKK